MLQCNAGKVILERAVLLFSFPFPKICTMKGENEADTGRGT